MSKAEDKVKRIIEVVESILKHHGDPFSINVQLLFDELNNLLPEIMKEDLMLDITTVDALVNLIKAQDNWIRMESSLLVLGPLLALLKVKKYSLEELAQELTNAWTPIVEVEYLSKEAIKKGLEYIQGKRKYFLSTEEGEYVRKTSLNELEELGFLGEAFTQYINKFKRNLIEKLNKKQKLRLWDIIYSDDYHETLINALALSHILTMNLVSLAINPLTNEIFITKARNGEALSFPIVVTREQWMGEKKRLKEKST